MSELLRPTPLQVEVVCAGKLIEADKSDKEGIRRYNATSKNRGVAKLINIHTIEGHSYRIGSNVDVQNLASLFEQIGFSVDVHSQPENTMTYKEVDKVLNDFIVDERLVTANVLVLFIMSHGGQKNRRDYFYTSDKQIYYYEVVQNFFKNDRCTSMKQKPKMIFFQTCRGDAPDQGVCFDGGPVSQPEAVDLNERKMPSCTDLLVAYATTAETSACRWPDVGSLFVHRICEQFMKLAHEMDVVQMLDIVYEKMANEKILSKDGIIMQSGQLTKFTFGLLYLNPGIYRDENGDCQKFNDASRTFLLNCREGEVDNVKRMLETNDNIDVNVAMHHIACHALKHSDALCELLRQYGAKIDSKDKFGNTPLHLAAHAGNEGMCNYLIRNGCLVGETNNMGNTAVHSAAIADQFISCSPRWT